MVIGWQSLREERWGSEEEKEKEEGQEEEQEEVVGSRENIVDDKAEGEHILPGRGT